MANIVVVGVDGTADSLAALAVAATMAEESGADLDVVHVRHVAALTSVGGEAGAVVAESDALDEIEHLSRQRASDLLAGHHLRWRFDVAVGDPATELVAAARARKATTIVVGGRNHGVVGGLVVGSVAQKLVRHSPVSVLVVRDGKVRGRSTWSPPGTATESRRTHQVCNVRCRLRPAAVSPRALPAGPRSGARAVIEWVVILVAALVVAIVVKTFVVQAFKILQVGVDGTDPLAP